MSATSPASTRSLHSVEPVDINGESTESTPEPAIWFSHGNIKHFYKIWRSMAQEIHLEYSTDHRFLWIDRGISNISSIAERRPTNFPFKEKGSYDSEDGCPNSVCPDVAGLPPPNKQNLWDTCWQEPHRHLSDTSVTNLLLTVGPKISTSLKACRKELEGKLQGARSLRYFLEVRYQWQSFVFEYEQEQPKVCFKLHSPIL